MDRVPADATSLIASSPDVVVAIGGRVIPVLLELTRSVPIVVPGAADPVGVGWIQSMARPGGNITGFTFFELSVLAKMLDILRQISPAAARAAYIYNPDNRSSPAFLSAFEGAANLLAIEPVTVPIRHRAGHR
jgi:putative ABC transport system substrate-binding protein